MNTIKVPYSKFEAAKDEIEEWLKTRGKGSARYGGRAGEIKHWLGGDDWCYYNQWDREQAMSDTVFLFRHDTDAVEFALRFA